MIKILENPKIIIASLLLIGLIVLLTNNKLNSKVSEKGTKEYLMTKSEAEWKDQLGEQAYEVLRKHGTERAFTGKYLHTKDDGIYRCKACNTALFNSDTKFNSGTGWPSFTNAITENIGTKVDNRYGMKRVEVHCKKCGSHLGHIFNDGPAENGLRYCINSVCLDLEKEETPKK